jgi:hypothetical protein
MLSLQENVTIYSQALDHRDTRERARRQAKQLFWRVFSEGKRRQLWNSLICRRNHLHDLGETLQHTQVKSRHAVSLQNVNIAEIRGSEGRCQDFDAAFRPTHNRTEERWVNIATAIKLDVTLPPVELIQVGDVYYVRDGHHRISVAKSFGQIVIEAEVIVWEI